MFRPANPFSVMLLPAGGNALALSNRLSGNTTKTTVVNGRALPCVTRHLAFAQQQQQRRGAVTQHHATAFSSGSGDFSQTPHSGYHFDGTPRRFFEGWYWKVQLPDSQDSFAVIFSVEDPAGSSKKGGLGVQVMGPGDGYICQYSKATQALWADRK